MRLVIVLLVLNAPFLYGQISTDAPSVSAGATTVGRNVFQIESRLQYTKEEYFESFQIPSTLFRIGLGNKFELRLINGINLANNTASVPRLNLGFKVQLFKKEGSNTQVAFLMDAPIPKIKTLTNGYSLAIATSGTFAVNHSLNEKNSIGYNVGFGYGIFGSTGSYIENHNISLSAIYSRVITERLTLFGELYGGYHHQTSPINLEGNGLNIDMGFMYLLTGKIQFDYSYGFGILDEMNFHAIGFNFMIGPKD